VGYPYASGVTLRRSGTPSTAAEHPPRSLPVAIARYGVARLGLVAVLTGVLVLVGVPLLVALLVALVVALPLSLLLLPGLRRELDDALAEAGRRRAEQKARLRAQLRGLDEGSAQPPSPDERSAEQSGTGQADRGAERPDQHDHGGVAEHGDQLTPGDPSAHPTQRG
jgi:Protein of unknown function (DUF4229)